MNYDVPAGAVPGADKPAEAGGNLDLLKDGFAVGYCHSLCRLDLSNSGGALITRLGVLPFPLSPAPHPLAADAKEIVAVASIAAITVMRRVLRIVFSFIVMSVFLWKGLLQLQFVKLQKFF